MDWHVPLRRVGGSPLAPTPRLPPPQPACEPPHRALQAWSRGLGCVINSQGIMQSPVVREHAAIPDDQVIMKAVAMGYPDWEFPANRVYSNRRDMADAVRFVGFPEETKARL